MPNPVAPVVDLTGGERSQFLSWSGRSNTANAFAVRSRIVLAAAEGLSNTAIADRHDVHISSAHVWTKTADQILESVANYCQRINASGH